MGAAASTIANEDLPENIRETLEMCEKQKYAIAEYDNVLFDREMEKVFKKHGKIISTLTSRTKSQLRKANHLKKSTPDEVFKLLGGNHYAKFFKYLYMSKQELEIESVRTSSKADYDEELLVQIIGTANMKELTLFMEMYHIERKQTLLETFEEKAKKNAPLLKLVRRLLSERRDESRSVDQELAAEQAAEIHKAGAARLKGVDEDVIFGIILGNSRAQLAAVADIYLTKFHIKFERAVNMKFKGSCARLILLLSMPQPNAVASCIYTLGDRFLIDKVAIMTIIAKYDKDFLQQVDMASDKMFGKNLVGLAGRGFSGNLFNALQGWVENPSPDKGYERILEMFLEGKLLAGHDLRALIDEEDFQQRVLFLLTRQNEEITKYMKEHRIKFNPNDAFQLNLMQSFDSMKHKAVEDAQRAIIDKYSLKRSAKEADDKYDAKQRKVMAYLKKYFQANDPNTTGIFSEARFWELMQQLPLAALGFTAEEVASMRDWTEWSVDGSVQYFEVLFELCDTVINAIESKADGHNDVIAVVDELQEDPSLIRLAKTERRLSNSMNLFNAVPEYFLQLLYDTFEAFDFDNNKYLCAKEISSLIGVLNIEELTLELFLNDSADSITHKAAVEIVSKIVNPWFLTRAEDHYICLIDKDSGLYFWFNTRDESSQWADTGDYGQDYDYNYLEYSPSTRPTAGFSAKSTGSDGHKLAQDAKKALSAIEDDEFGYSEEEKTPAADAAATATAAAAATAATAASDIAEAKTAEAAGAGSDVKGVNSSDEVAAGGASGESKTDSDRDESKALAEMKAESTPSAAADGAVESESKGEPRAAEEREETKSSKARDAPPPPAVAGAASDDVAEPKASPRAPDPNDSGAAGGDSPTVAAAQAPAAEAAQAAEAPVVEAAADAPVAEAELGTAASPATHDEQNDAGDSAADAPADAVKTALESPSAATEDATEEVKESTSMREE